MELEKRMPIKSSINLKFDHDASSNTIVGTKKIFDQKFGLELATVGIQWSNNFLYHLWRNVSRMEPGWAECTEVKIRLYRKLSHRRTVAAL